MAPTIVAARQLISHGHIRLNNKKVNIPSYMCKPKDVISVAMKQKSLKLINRNLQDYYKRMRFYKKRLAKTIAFILYKLKLVSNMSIALQLINQGKLKINNKRVRTPNYICSAKDVISIQTKQGNVNSSGFISLLSSRSNPEQLCLSYIRGCMGKPFYSMEHMLDPLRRPSPAYRMALSLRG